MNFSIQLAVVVALCLCIAESAPEGRMTRAKQQRPTRGFKNVEMMTARGFGKRDRPHSRPEHVINYETHPRKKFNPKNSLMVAYDFGKRSSNDDVDEEEEIRVTRGTFKPNSNILIARGYGKRNQKPESDRASGLANFWEMLESAPEREGQEINDENTMESIPLDWFVNEMLNNPDFARSVVHKFIDLNQDFISNGRWQHALRKTIPQLMDSAKDNMLSSDELLRNV